MYSRVITPSAKKSLRKLPNDAQHGLMKASLILESNPLTGETLHGVFRNMRSFHWKFQRVQYRLAYSVNKEKQLIIVHYVGPRENFYDRLLRLLT